MKPPVSAAYAVPIHREDQLARNAFIRSAGSQTGRCCRNDAEGSAKIFQMDTYRILPWQECVHLLLGAVAHFPNKIGSSLLRLCTPAPLSP